MFPGYKNKFIHPEICVKEFLLNIDELFNQYAGSLIYKEECTKMAGVRAF